VPQKPYAIDFIKKIKFIVDFNIYILTII